MLASATDIARLAPVTKERRGRERIVHVDRGASVQGRGCYAARVRDGKIIEFRSMPDIAGMMMQLGFMPEM